MSDVATTVAPVGRPSDSPLGALKGVAVAAGAVMLLAGCAATPQHQAGLGSSKIDPRLGVSASERVVFGDDPVPRGGGSYLVGRPYVIGGKSYYPSERPQGYSVVGTASWYGDAFHGRRTANGEVFDRNSISAAHPTLPLPSYVRVTNTGNGRSMIVRVNDRGPYHGGRVMDVSQRVAETLDFRRAGTARIRVDYVSRAALAGSDDEKLLATLRTDGVPAQLAGVADESTSVAAAAPPTPPAPSAPPQAARVARLNRSEEQAPATPETKPALQPVGRLVHGPLPPARPFETSAAERSVPLPPTGGRGRHADRTLASLLQQR